jgi:hypothetical protein
MPIITTIALATFLELGYGGVWMSVWAPIIWRVGTMLRFDQGNRKVQGGGGGRPLATSVLVEVHEEGIKLAKQTETYM